MNAPNTDAAGTPDVEPPIKLPLHPPPANMLFHRSGLALTGAWVCGWILYIAVNREAVAGLAPNEAGDFLAGVFAPLAFLWLVLGFFQQGHELRHSAEALWLQGRELQNSVEQQRELVRATRDSLEFESSRLTAEREELDRLAQPKLEMRLWSRSRLDDGRLRHVIRLESLGRPCTGFVLRVEDKVVHRKPVLETGEHKDFTFIAADDEERRLTVFLEYIDANLVPRSESRLIHKVGDVVQIERLNSELTRTKD